MLEEEGETNKDFHLDVSDNTPAHVVVGGQTITDAAVTKTQKFITINNSAQNPSPMYQSVLDDQ